MMYEEILDLIVKARSDVLRADKLLAQWDLRGRKKPGQDQYTLLATLIKQANDALDHVVSGIVRESAKESEAESVIPTRLGRNSPAHPARLS